MITPPSPHPGARPGSRGLGERFAEPLAALVGCVEQALADVDDLNVAYYSFSLLANLVNEHAGGSTVSGLWFFY